MKHKHAELIKLWADGAEIEYKYISGFTNTWTEWKAKNNDGWIETDNYQYRIKPEPKPDVVYYANFRKGLVPDYHIEKFRNDNLRLTFCAETGELKSAEVL